MRVLLVLTTAGFGRVAPLTLGTGHAAASGILDVAVATHLVHRAPTPPPLPARARAGAPRRPGRVEDVVQHPLDEPVTLAEAVSGLVEVVVRDPRRAAASFSPARAVLLQLGDSALLRHPASPHAALMALPVARSPS